MIEDSVRPASSPARAACVLAAMLPAATLPPAVARAQPRSMVTTYSAYEERAIDEAASALGTSVDPAPEGKTIERVDFVRVEPIDAHDPAPAWLNALHVASRETVLRHELLVGEGSRWSSVLVDESARNLRQSSQLSLVLCVPMRSSAAGRVRLVVITKDVWSLYVDFDIDATPGGLELLDLEPKETNFAGLQQTVLGRFVLQPLSFSLGASYVAPRFDTRWLSLAVDANVVVNRARGAVEGSYGSASIGQPLSSSLAKWAWSVGVEWDDEVYRRYVNAAVDQFVPTAPGVDRVPWAYRKRTMDQEAEIVRSTGWRTKNDVALGASFQRSSYVVPQPAAFDAAALAQFEAAALPTSEKRAGPFVQWHGYSSDFLRILDFDTLGLQEDYRLGHDLWVRLYPVFRALGSTRDFLGVYTAAAYGVRFGDGIARALVESTVETETGGVADASLSFELGVVSPRIGVGRLLYELHVLDRARNHLHALSLLGGDSQLRGYPSRYFAGEDLVTSNLEYRSRPIQLASIQWALAAFYDVGDAFNGFENLVPRHAVGLGLRVVLPQIERAVLRFDVGVPLSASPLPSGVPPVSFLIAFGQALSLPAATPPGMALPE